MNNKSLQRQSFFQRLADTFLVIVQERNKKILRYSMQMLQQITVPKVKSPLLREQTQAKTGEHN
jgi:hypothetical protein